MPLIEIRWTTLLLLEQLVPALTLVIRQAAIIDDTIRDKRTSLYELAIGSRIFVVHRLDMMVHVDVVFETHL